MRALSTIAAGAGGGATSSCPKPGVESSMASTKSGVPMALASVVLSR
ncbi:hypothetical protein IMCC9480_1236 [Oxalobacteraceae bacterium IMCC9480]|nr:hypothetical protein IMCC9480_1236 [Oxalobacteraceae bacterium IMCC9480]